MHVREGERTWQSCVQVFVMRLTWWWGWEVQQWPQRARGGGRKTQMTRAIQSPPWVLKTWCYTSWWQPHYLPSRGTREAPDGAQPMTSGEQQRGNSFPTLHNNIAQTIAQQAPDSSLAMCASVHTRTDPTLWCADKQMSPRGKHSLCRLQTTSQPHPWTGCRKL